MELSLSPPSVVDDAGAGDVVGGVDVAAGLANRLPVRLLDGPTVLVVDVVVASAGFGGKLKRLPPAGVVPEILVSTQETEP